MIKSAIQATALTVSLAAMDAGTVRADVNNWYLQQLFAPTDHQLAMERKGRIMIYDGLRDTDVERVLDTQFQRVGSMMFTGTVVTDDSGEPARDAETGEIIVENDGCD